MDYTDSSARRLHRLSMIGRATCACCSRSKLVIPRVKYGRSESSCSSRPIMVEKQQSTVMYGREVSASGLNWWMKARHGVSSAEAGRLHNHTT